MSPQVTVIGAGLGGLSAAIALAARGVEVTVLEAGPRAGGKAGVAEVDGVRFDTGPSVLTLPEVIDGLLREAGASLEAELTLRRPSPAFRYVFPDGPQVDLYHAREDSLASVRAALGSDAGDELSAFLDYAARIWDLSAPAFVFGPAPGLHLLARYGASALTLLPQVDPLRAMWRAICAKVSSPHLRALLARYATYNGSDPRRAPATLNCIAHVELSLGGYGVEGGVYALVEALERVARRLGVDFHFSAPVTRLVFDGEAVRGVEAGAASRSCDAVVCNADVAHLVQTLLPPQRALKATTTPSMSGWTGTLRARRRVGDEARVAHTVLFPEDYLQEFVDIFDEDRPPQVPTVYLCAQEACHGRQGWAEHEPVFIMANAPAEPAEGERDEALWTSLQERCLARARSAGLLDPDDMVVWSRTPTELARRFPGSRGALYGAASNSTFAAFRRPPNRPSGLPGLYLASGSAHPGGGMPLCVQSGREAAHALLEDLGHGAAT